MNWLILIMYICICTFFIIFNHILIKSKGKLIEEKSELIKENLHIKEELAKTKVKKEDYDKELMQKDRMLNFYRVFYDELRSVAHKSYYSYYHGELKLTNLVIYDKPEIDIIKTENFNEVKLSKGYTTHHYYELIECCYSVDKFDEPHFERFKQDMLRCINKYGYTVKGIYYLQLEKEIKIIFEGGLI